jgi:hypothetical protein
MPGFQAADAYRSAQGTMLAQADGAAGGDRHNGRFGLELHWLNSGIGSMK